MTTDHPDPAPAGEEGSEEGPEKPPPPAPAGGGDAPTEESSPAPSGNVEAQTEADAGDEPASAGPSRRGVLMGLGVVAVALVAILAIVLLTGGNDAPSTSSQGTTATSATPGSTAPPVTLSPSSYTSFHDDVTGFTISYPKTWERDQAPIADVRLIVSPGSDQGQAVSVRVNHTDDVTTPSNLANLKTVTDGIIGSNPSARVLKQDTVSINGLIGYYYLYTFKDATGLDGVHAHYFLFSGHNMYSIVFQALPASQFTRFAGIFDQIAQSFKVEAATGPTTTTGTAAPPTSTP